MNDPYENAAHAFRNARFVVAVTGAGISVESGISSFRGAGGIWSKYPIEEYAVIDAFVSNPKKVWDFWYEIGAVLQGCQPNPAHQALAELEKQGACRAIITQNIDDLHEKAGSTHVIKYHGSAHHMVCMDCGHKRPLDWTRRTELIPRCACGGLMKPDVVMFGEMIPPDAMYEADRLARRCDLMIVVGTSAQVFPAAQLPYTAKDNGAFIIEANTEKTDFTRTITNAFLMGPAGQTLPKLLHYIQAHS